MKKSILVMLIAVLTATPCLAQEIEPEGIFSLHGTEWQALPIGVQILPFPFVSPLFNSEFGFYGGKIYPTWVFNASFYIDMLVCSIFWGVDIPGFRSGGTYWYYGILQPIGMGMVVEMTYYPLPRIIIGLLIKTDNNWTPPEVE